MIWTAKEYADWINKGRPINQNAITLTLDFKLTSLDGMKNLVNLKVLHCSYNRLTIYSNLNLKFKI